MRPVDLLRFLGFYWRTVVIIIVPLIFLPLWLNDNIPPKRCLYVVAVMALYWMLEVLPLGVTGLIPMVLFPLLGVMDSKSTSMCYMKETNMMFLGGLFIAIAIEHCNLHTRIALITLKVIGCSPRLLLIGLMSVTSLLSWWIVNTAATAMMIPIVMAILHQLEEQGFGKIYKERLDEDADSPPIDLDENRKPSGLAKCLCIATAYAANIGGVGTLVGTGTNLTFKGIYEETFPMDDEGISFLKWMAFNAPLTLIIAFFVIIYMEFFYLGLFRPNSTDAKACAVGKEGKLAAHNVIKQKLADLGPMSFHEASVLFLFVLCILLWIFRQPQFILGWVDYISMLVMKDSGPAIFAIIVMFIVPKEPKFLQFFSSDEEKKPKKASPGLVTWKVLESKMPWGLLFLLGGGFAISEAANRTGMGDMVANWMSFTKQLDKVAIMVIFTFFTSILTQIISSNVAVCNIIMPVLMSMSKAANVHPIYITLPSAVACSMAFCLPISTPPNAIAAEPINMATYDMIKIGVGVAAISCICIILWFLAVGTILWDVSEFPPEWRNVQNSSDLEY